MTLIFSDSTWKQIAFSPTWLFSFFSQKMFWQQSQSYRLNLLQKKYWICCLISSWEMGGKEGLKHNRNNLCCWHHLFCSRYYRYVNSLHFGFLISHKKCKFCIPTCVLKYHMETLFLGLWHISYSSICYYMYLIKINSYPDITLLERRVDFNIY